MRKRTINAVAAGVFAVGAALLTVALVLTDAVSTAGKYALAGFVLIMVALVAVAFANVE